jgi:hypothetical protein
MIKAGWRETGIRPFNPSLVLQKMGYQTDDEQNILRVYDGRPYS